MKFKPLEWVALILTFFSLAGFFLPWVKLSVLPSHTLEVLAENIYKSLGSKNEFYLSNLFFLKKHEVRAANNEFFTGLKGYQLPAMVNEHSANGLIASLALQTFFGSKGVEQKALLMFAYPVLALASLLMILFVRQNRRLLLIPAFLAFIFYFWTRYRVISTELERSMMQMQMGWGVWVTIYSLFLMGILLVILSFLPIGGGKKRK